MSNSKQDLVSSSRSSSSSFGRVFPHLSHHVGDGRVWLIDPAVYRGDAEADLAMTELFGGFGQAFYRAYYQRRPPSSVYDSKRRIYNLYHLLNHYN